MNDLNADDLKLLDNYLVARQRMTNSPKHSVQKLLNKWSSFVSTLSKPYGFSIDDFTNDLTIRRILQELMVEFPALALKLQQIVRPDDDAFVRLTAPDPDMAHWAVPGAEFLARAPLRKSEDW